MPASRVYETRIDLCGLFAMLRMHAAVRRMGAPDLQIVAAGPANPRLARLSILVFILSHCKYCVIQLAGEFRKRPGTIQGSARETRVLAAGFVTVRAESASGAGRGLRRRASLRIE